MQEKAKAMDKMSNTFSALSEATLSRRDEPESADSLWAKSLVQQMQHMDQAIKDRFMMHVYQVAIEAINGKMPG